MKFKIIASMCAALILHSGTCNAASIDVFASRLSTPDQIINGFRREHPDVEVRVRPPVNGYDELTKRLLQNNLVGDLPDVIFQGYNRSRMTVQRRLPQPLESFVAQDEDWVRAHYHPISDALCRHDGKLYGLPYIVSVPVIYYNPALVKAVGGDPDHFPDTWEGITDLATKVTALGGNKIGGFFDYASAGNWTFMALVASQGGHMMSPDDRQIAFDGPEGKRALEVVQMFGQAGQIDMPRDQAYQAFSAGTMGLIVTSSGFLQKLLKQATFQVRTALLPASENGRFPAGGNCMMMLSKDPERQKAAWTFMKYMASPQVQEQMFDLTGYLPGNQLGIAQLEETAKSDDPRLVSVKASARAAEWYSFPGDNSLRITEVIESVLQDVVRLRMPPEEAMNRMKADVQKLLPR
ncbi:ABC transporter substrate-binding protein [Sinorhizobium meliloti]|uniref:ABC transporter substrate-binding protein n=1 Tax=Rhizobium meliloti TaxID=382 RepID=UPI0012976B5B|nr:ABC transporter substrate-binding protein [Sinorhizobium meliloti]MQX58190.1 extracellular solute-binding protein [Sinorhizobium meliloti]